MPTYACPCSMAGRGSVIDGTRPSCLMCLVTYCLSFSWFCVTMDYWKTLLPGLCHPRPPALADDDVEAVLAAEQGPDVERVSPALAQQIREGKCVLIRGLHKSFMTNTGIKHAVDDLNLTMYSGQITALLGHNGAGAATTSARTFSSKSGLRACVCLTAFWSSVAVPRGRQVDDHRHADGPDAALLGPRADRQQGHLARHAPDPQEPRRLPAGPTSTPPPDYDSRSNSYSAVASERGETDDNVCVLPCQHDVLFLDLTVEEHLILFARFKGVPNSKLKDVRRRHGMRLSHCLHGNHSWLT